MVSVVLVGGCYKEESANKAINVNTLIAAKKPTEAREVKDSKPLGVAGKLVQSFFKNWEFKRYSQMHRMTTHSRDKDAFTKHLAETPITWRNIIIKSEEQVGDDWKVNISMEVTDPACAFASCIINLEFPPDADSDGPKFRLTPSLLEIQDFMPIEQTWHVVNLDGEYFIDCCSGDSKHNRTDNIMNYVLDAANLGALELPSSSREERISTDAAVWLAMVATDLGISNEETINIMIKSKSLHKKAIKNLKETLQSFESLKGENSKNKKT